MTRLATDSAPMILAAESLIAMADDAPAPYADAMTLAAAALRPTVGTMAYVRELGRDDAFTDAPGPTLHLNGDVADTLLQARGWESRDGAWHSPLGARYWHRDEALTVALTAEAIGLGLEA